MDTKQIENIFETYLETKNTQYALLLNGSWGSGKTYFWEHQLRKVAEKKNYKQLYLSLNGISKIEDLENLFARKLTPIISSLENKTVKGTAVVAENLLNIWMKSTYKSTLKELIKGITIESFNFSGHIICFDDLERCQLSIQEALGFINRFVEQDKAKVIILSDEQKIANAEIYAHTKEKVIGRILNFAPNIKTIVPILFENYHQNKQFYQFLIDNQDTIVENFIQYKQNNLRTIAFYLTILEKIVPCFFYLEKEHIEKILYFSAVITIEFKSGRLKGDVDSIDYYKDFWTNDDWHDNSKKADEQSVYKQSFHDTYMKNRNGKFTIFSSLYAYITLGYFDETELQREIKEKCSIIPSKQQALQRLDMDGRNYRTLTNDDFDKFINTILTGTKQGEYKIYEYTKIARLLFYFSEVKLINYTSEQVKECVLEGLGKCQTFIKDEQFYDLVRERKDSFGSFKMSSEVTEIHERTQYKILALERERCQEKAEEFINHIIHEDEEDLKYLFGKSPFSSSLFSYLEDKKLLNALNLCSNSYLVYFTVLVKTRYDYTNSGEFLYKDSLWLEKLEKGLTTHLETAGYIHPLRKSLIQNLIDQLNTVCEHLEKTKKQ